MIYNFLQFFVNIGLRFYFRSIYFINEEAVPANEPVLITSNHSNSAMDALLISGLYKRKDLFWLARGDVFNNKWVAKFMAACRTAPIYRSSEVGFVDIKRNNDSFNVCFDLLGQNKMIGIFPEGITIPERRLQTPFKKGFARLAFQAHERLNRPVWVMPIGVSYQSLTKTRTDAFVKYGKPFSTALFFDEYQKNHAAGLKSLTLHLEIELNKSIINYDSVQNQAELNKHIYFGKLDLEAANIKELGFNRDDTYYQNDKKIVDYFIDKEAGTIEKDLIFEQNLLARKAKAISEPIKLNLISFSVYSWVAFLGNIIHFLPNQFSKYILKTKIKKPAFWGTTRFIILYLSFPLYILFLSILASFYSSAAFWFVFLLLPTIVFLGLRCRSLLEH
jgi:glycerol-3-phosphate O-acyltransferase / dihydroxyacetone phosphate acyltransferase